MAIFGEVGPINETEEAEERVNLLNNGSIWDDDIFEQDADIVIEDRRRKPHLSIILSILFYFFSVISPLMNNIILKGSKTWSGYPFPLASTWIQLVGVVLLLFVSHLLSHRCHRQDLLSKSWVFGPGLIKKCWTLFPVALAFALLVSLTNWGIFLISVHTHILLRSTEIIWVVLFAGLIQKEKPSWLTLLCCALLVIGTVFITVDFSTSGQEMKNATVALIVNLSAAICSGLMIVLLRRAVLILEERNRTISITEITLIKLTMAAILVAPFPFIFESDSWLGFWDANVRVQVLVGIGVLVTMFYQSTTVGLTSYALATTVGILTQSKIIPQLALAVAWENSSTPFKPTGLHLCGVFLTIISTIGYSLLRYHAYREQGQLADLESKYHQVL